MSTAYERAGESPLKTTTSYMPIVECPSCEQESQWDDYYFVKPGTTRECQHCGVELEVLSVDTTIECRIGVKFAPSEV